MSPLPSGTMGRLLEVDLAAHTARTHPLDERLGLKGHSPGLQYFKALFTGQNVYGKAMDQFHKIFRPDGQDEISLRKTLDMDYELGEALEDLRQQEIEQVLEQLVAQIPQKEEYD